ncbi:RNA polymerase sigma factor [Conexibacter sp. CPCC 206217]|uniref:RNA polymerase sigma factor n=1 Tax=Conexibacter sp. CPCC 206217 TaxID=3064574 RepID=UPI002726BF45|nr:sigma-70 region 4 domain-containing protein [Conexibacter sp. CPCC 206217]MDO8210448.1 sigma-70 region 4 domain-containing protein [Conexibacter sp. CPCC 206217]
MSAFQSLPPDQRAVLQLILKQGRGYADLSGLLRIDEAAVRARAHAGLEALAPAGTGAALSPERRGQIADYLLGQQDDAERAVTLQHLDDSRAARRWAGALHERLAPLADVALPDLPARNGSAPRLSPAPLEPADDADGDALDADTTDLDGLARTTATDAETDDAARDGASNAAAAQAFGWDEPDRPRRSSKLGGALLLIGIAALVAVVLIVVLNGGSDDDSPSASSGAAPQTQAQTQRTTADRAAANEPTFLQQVNLRPPGGGERPLGVAFILLRDNRPVVAVQVQDIAANGADDVYAAWLRQSSDGNARFLGYFPGRVGPDSRFAVSADLPRDTADYDQVVISREPLPQREIPARPAEILLEGPLRVNRTG